MSTRGGKRPLSSGKGEADASDSEQPHTGKRRRLSDASASEDRSKVTPLKQLESVIPSSSSSSSSSSSATPSPGGPGFRTRGRQQRAKASGRKVSRSRKTKSNSRRAGPKGPPTPETRHVVEETAETTATEATAAASAAVGDDATAHQSDSETVVEGPSLPDETAGGGAFFSDDEDSSDSEGEADGGLPPAASQPAEEVLVTQPADETKEANDGNNEDAEEEQFEDVFGGGAEDAANDDDDDDGSEPDAEQAVDGEFVDLFAHLSAGPVGHDAAPEIGMTQTTILNCRATVRIIAVHVNGRVVHIIMVSPPNQPTQLFSFSLRRIAVMPEFNEDHVVKAAELYVESGVCPEPTEERRKYTRDLLNCVTTRCNSYYKGTAVSLKTQYAQRCLALITGTLQLPINQDAFSAINAHDVNMVGCIVSTDVAFPHGQPIYRVTRHPGAPSAIKAVLNYERNAEANLLVREAEGGYFWMSKESISLFQLCLRSIQQGKIDGMACDFGFLADAEFRKLVIQAGHYFTMYPVKGVVDKAPIVILRYGPNHAENLARSETILDVVRRIVSFNVRKHTVTKAVEGGTVQVRRFIGAPSLMPDTAMQELNELVPFVKASKKAKSNRRAMFQLF